MNFDHQPNASLRLAQKANWYGLKPYIKASIIKIPFYGLFCSLMRRHIPEARLLNLRRLPVTKKFVSAKSNNIQIILTNPNVDSIAKEIWWLNGRRYPSCDQIALDLFVSVATNCDLVLDIGCRNGIFCLFAAKANKQLIALAFDILPQAFILTSSNIIENNLSSRVFPFLLGIGEKSLFRAPTSNNLSSLPTSFSTSIPFTDGIDVRIDTLDHLKHFF
jgi:hypothetical protein